MIYEGTVKLDVTVEIKSEYWGQKKRVSVLVKEVECRTKFSSDMVEVVLERLYNDDPEFNEAIEMEE